MVEIRIEKFKFTIMKLKKFIFLSLALNIKRGESLALKLDSIPDSSKVLWKVSPEEGVILNEDGSMARLPDLEKVAEKWMKKYPLAIKSWQTNWAELSPFFQFTPEIRRIMYTTNGIESYNHSLRKMTKTKASFPTQESLEKVLYLAYRNAKKKWDKSITNWALIVNQLAIHFEGRFTV